MLEIIRQHEDIKEGNNCNIKDCIVWMKCHQKHMVMIIRRYIGWCDNGINLYCHKEFDKSNEACDCYWRMVNNYSERGKFQ